MESVSWAVEDQYRKDGGYACFACRGRGFFLLPNVEEFKLFLLLWVRLKIQMGKQKEVESVSSSEINFIEVTWTTGRMCDYENALQSFWEDVLFRINRCKSGGVFVTEEENQNPLFVKFDKIWARFVSKMLQENE